MKIWGVYRSEINSYGCKAFRKLQDNKCLENTSLHSEVIEI